MPPIRPRAPAGALLVTVLAALALVLGACGTGSSPSPASAAPGTPSAAVTDPPASANPSPAEPSDAASVGPSASPTEPPSGSITLYTSVTQATVDAVLAAFAEAHPDVTVELFRAPTGELAARIAADLRDQGRIGGDVLWLTDPLSLQAYDEDGLLRAFEPPSAAELPEAYVGDTSWGTRILNMVMVAAPDADPAPTDWDDLTDPAFQGAVAFPNPNFAGSAFGALGYFAQTPEYGTDFYQRLKDNGATQVQAPDEVTTGVAEGRFKAGMTLDFSVRSAADKGSPVELVWPGSGAIAITSPIAVVDATENGGAAEAFVDFTISRPGQEAIAGTGWQPVLEGAGGPPPGGDQVRPDWEEAYGRQEELLEDYGAIFGG